LAQSFKQSVDLKDMGRTPHPFRMVVPSEGARGVVRSEKLRFLSWLFRLNFAVSRPGTHERNHSPTAAHSAQRGSGSAGVISAKRGAELWPVRHRAQPR